MNLYRHPIYLIANSFASEHDPLPCEPVSGTCAVTGIEGLCLPRKYALGKSFTNLDLLAAPYSEKISIEAYRTLKYKWARMACWLCDGTSFQRLARLQIRQLVLNGIEAGQWCGHITTSYKKHGALRARINTTRHGWWVFDERLVDCSDSSAVRNLYVRLDEMIHAGAGRNVLLTLVAPAYVIGKIGLANWLDFERWARPIHQSGLYELMVYLLPSIAELKAEEKIKQEKLKAEEKTKQEEIEADEFATAKNKYIIGRQRSLF
jgi:hypothetical protein